MDTFNIISGIITIVSFVFALLIYIKDKSLKSNIEAGLLSLIHSLDKLALMAEKDKFNKTHMGVISETLRDQAISLLKSFSKEEKRFNTFGFGITEENIEEIIKKREEMVGLDHKGCIIANQWVNGQKANIMVEDLKPGMEIKSLNSNLNNLLTSTVDKVSSHNVGNYVEINNKLSVTSTQKLFCKRRGWIYASEITIGDELLTQNLEWETIGAILLKKECSIAYAISTNSNNLFVNGYLVHNKL